MAKFRNDGDVEIKFKARGKEYAVKPKGEVSIDDSIAYIVESRKLPLVSADSPKPAEPPAKEPKAPKEKAGEK